MMEAFIAHSLVDFSAAQTPTAKQSKIIESNFFISRLLLKSSLNRSIARVNHTVARCFSEQNPVAVRNLRSESTCSQRVNRARTLGLASSRSASLPTHRGDASLDAASRLAVVTAALLRFNECLPIVRNAQFTAFFTKLRSSRAPSSMRGSRARNCGSRADLSCATSEAIKANPARLMNSLGELDHWRALSQANEVRSKRWKQAVSQIPQLSKSRHQRSI